MSLTEPTPETSTGLPGTPGDIVARLERLPAGWWQARARIIVGTATFFDAFDVLAIATAIPVLLKTWSMTPAAIGPLISAAFVGQLMAHSCSVRWPSVTAGCQLSPPACLRSRS